MKESILSAYCSALFPTKFAFAIPSKVLLLASAQSPDSEVPESRSQNPLQLSLKSWLPDFFPLADFTPPNSPFPGSILYTEDSYSAL